MFDKYFTRQLEIKLTASMLGISKRRWQCVNDNSPNKLKEAKQKMESNRFDVLPIVKKNNEREIVESYFVTKQWNNFDQIEELKIKKSDKINCKINVKHLVEKFVRNSRNFYFLEFKNEIVGLVSIVNLNAKEFRIYLYTSICELEILLREFVYFSLGEENLLKITSERFQTAMERYNDDKESGVESPIVEYLDLVHFIKIIRFENLYHILGFKSKNAFDKIFSSLNEIRNPIAHPTRSLITSPKSIEKLAERMEKLEKAINILKDHAKTANLAC